MDHGAVWLGPEPKAGGAGFSAGG